MACPPTFPHRAQLHLREMGCIPGRCAYEGLGMVSRSNEVVGGCVSVRYAHTLLSAPWLALWSPSLSPAAKMEDVEVNAQSS
jgi:hypothetical protein